MTSTIQRDHFVTLASYNAWANRRLYDTAAALSEDDLQRDVGIYSGSVIALLNHVLVVDRLWMVQVTGDGEVPDSEDDVVFEDLGELREARELEDGRIIAFAERLFDQDLANVVRYRTVQQPVVEEQPLSAVLAHLFNHQNHHRGECTVGLSVLGVATPPLGFLDFKTDTAGGRGARSA